MAIDYLPVSWNKYQTLARRLASRLLTRGVKVDEIVAIARGGLTLGHLLTDYLRVPISTFTIQSYTDIKSQGKVKITKPLPQPIFDKTILLVDDVSDTGKTLIRAKEYLKTLQPKKVITLTMFFKPQSVYKPDYFIGTTNAWIIFPYERTETMISIMNTMKKEGADEKEIESFLLRIGFTRDHISFSKKFYFK